MNCKNCKHWRRGGSLVREHGRFGLNPDYTGEIVGKTSDKQNVVCMADAKAKTGLCLHPALGSDYVDGWLNRKLPEDRIDGVFAGCGENRGHLATGEDFGCVHFQHNTRDDRRRSADSAQPNGA